MNRAFRAVHPIKGGAGVFDLMKIGDLAHQTENVLVLIRSHEMAPVPERVGVLLRTADRLHKLIQNPGLSNQTDISEVMAALAKLLADPRASAMRDSASAVERTAKGGRNLRALLVEDDSASWLLLQTILSRYSECHVAVNGREAVEALCSALERGERYDLICMDIMMPEMDGRDAVRRARALESRAWHSLELRREDHHDHGRRGYEGSDPTFPGTLRRLPHAYRSRPITEPHEVLSTGPVTRIASLSLFLVLYFGGSIKQHIMTLTPSVR
jgi:CheY-like chemotaxis protein